MELCNFYCQIVGPGVQKVMGFFPDDFVALQTAREGGVSLAPFDSFNLATHVGDRPEAVAKNRAGLNAFLPTSPFWLEQVHGCDMAILKRGAEAFPSQFVGDAGLTAEAEQVCAVMTADCLPLLVARPGTGQCAAIHAGWKGLAAGVIEKTLQRMLDQRIGGESPSAPLPKPLLPAAPDAWYIWLGPAIGQNAFEVGPEVQEKFVHDNPKAAAAFLPSRRREGHFMASLQQLALLRLKTFESVNTGCEIRVAIDQDCVFTTPQKYFSYRRDGTTGRMASLIFRRIGSRT